MEPHTSNSGAPVRPGLFKRAYHSVAAIGAAFAGECALRSTLLAFAFLLPIFTIPFGHFSIESAKTILVAFTALLLLAQLAVRFWLEKIIRIPKSGVLLSIGAFTLALAISAFASSARERSLFGVLIEPMTLLVVASAAIIALAVGFAARTVDHVRALLTAILAGVFALFAGQIILPFTSIGVFARLGLAPGDALAGGAFECALAAAVAVMIGAVAYLAHRSNGRIRTILVATATMFSMLIALLALGDRGLAGVLTLALLSLLFAYFAAKVARARSTFPEMDGHDRTVFAARRVPVLIVIVLAFCAAGTFGFGAFPFGGVSGAARARFSLAAPTNDVTIPMRETATIVARSLAEAPAVGVGPNRYAALVLKYRSFNFAKITGFDAGRLTANGLPLTTAATCGAIGLLALLALYLALAGNLRNIVRASVRGREEAYVFLAAVLGAFVVWGALVFHPFRVFEIALAFFYAGLVVAAARANGFLGESTIDFSSRVFLRGLISLALLFVVGYSGIALAARIRATRYLAAGQSASAVGLSSAARANFAHAFVLAHSDVAATDVASAALAEVRALDALKSNDQDISAHRLAAFTAAKYAASAAVLSDPESPLDRTMLGLVFEAIDNHGVRDALPFAQHAYEDALARDQYSPIALTALARVHMASGDVDGGVAALEQVVSLRPNYFEAVELLSAYRERMGDEKGYVTVLANAALADLSDPRFAAQLGDHHMKNGKYGLAARAYAVAVRAAQTNADVRFSFARALDLAGQPKLALQQLLITQQLAPNSSLLQNAISALQSGVDPFGSVAPTSASTSSATSTTSFATSTPQ